MRILISTLIILLFFSANGQDTINPIAPAARDSIFPQFKGGEYVLYNRGIGWFYLGDKEKACEDWQSILDSGSTESQALMEEYCK